MSDGHRDLDGWLVEPVQPMLPPPEAFERIRRRARRRKAARALVSVAATAVVLAGAAAIPRLAGPLTHGFRPAESAAGAALPRHPAERRAPHPPRPAARPLRTAVGRAHARSAPLLSGVTSVTFVGRQTGWVLGQLSSLAICRSNGKPSCPVLARTENGGRTWRQVPAPPAGVSQIRFLDTHNGWAFGPQLWATHDGGRAWRQVPTDGLRVTALETRGTRVFAVWARCHGRGPGYASDCTSYSLRSAAAADITNAWTSVPGAPALNSLRGGGAALVLTGSQNYLLGPSGTLLRGPAAGGAAWGAATYPGSAVAVSPPCWLVGRGGPPAALLAAAGPAQGQELIELCLSKPTGNSEHKVLWYSPDGGSSWQRKGNAPVTGLATSLSGTLAGCLLLATNEGILVSSRPGGRWAPATVAHPPAGGFSYVGMTTTLRGVALPADPQVAAVWLTHDGGLVWRRYAV